ncbi:MAG TPA: hypothetical protein VJZ26_05775 [Blastocatellia bacterium]|nr:hypothetical protein [Blastocatellia bacterium]
MKTYIQIQVPSMSLPANRGALPGPVAADSSEHLRGRLPGPVGGDAWKPSERRFLEETIAGGSITLELDDKNKEWRVKPPAFAHWNYYLPATHGKWARNADEITICDAIDKRVYYSLRQANKMNGRAFCELSPAGRAEMRTEWKRIPKPLPVSGEPAIWYGLAIADSGGVGVGTRRAAAVVLSANKWFSFSMPWPTTGAFRGYGWNAAFVLLTGYIDRGDLVAHPGSGVDYELSLGSHWGERAEPLNQVARFKFEELTQFALRNAETLRAMGKAAVHGMCVDYDERHVIISDLFGAGIRAAIYAYTGECVAIDGGARQPASGKGDKAASGKPANVKPGPPSLDNLKMKEV